jgi:lipopolysaccharide assembly protein A
MRYLYGALTLLVAIVCAVFAVSNRTPVALSLWPFAGALELPVFILVLGTTLVGLLLGLKIGWLVAMPGRLARRRLAQRLVVAEQDVRRLKAEIASQAAAVLPSVVARVGA